MSETKSDPREQMAPAKLAMTRKLAGSEDLAVLRVEPDSGSVPAFQAGQHTTLAFEREGEAVLRYFSIASPPETTDAVDFYVRRPVPKAGEASTSDLFDLPPGAPLWLGEPGGGFTLERTACSHLAFVSNGTGLAPFRSMLGHLRASGAQPAGVTLWHGARLEGDLGFRAELEELQAQQPFPFRYVPTLTGGTAAGISNGRVEELLARFLEWPSTGDSRGASFRGDEDAVRALMPAGDTAIFLCGHPDMTKAVIAGAEGTPYQDHLVYDLW